MALAPLRSASEEEGGVIDEAEAIAIWIEAVEGPLVPRLRFDWRDLLRTGSDSSLVDGIEFVSRKVHVVRSRAQRPGGLDLPIDDRHDHFSAVEIEATRDGVICVDAEQALVERSGDRDLRRWYRDSKDTHLSSPFSTVGRHQTVDRLAQIARSRAGCPARRSAAMHAVGVS